MTIIALWFLSLSFRALNQAGTPLALYTFTSSCRHEKVINACPAAAAVRNDALVHIAVQDLPFGGLGTSGMGKYMGKASFDTFTHIFSSSHHPFIDPPCGIRYDTSISTYLPCPFYK